MGMCAVGVSVRGFEGQEGRFNEVCLCVCMHLCLSKAQTQKKLAKHLSTQLSQSRVSSIRRDALLSCARPGREASAFDLGWGGWYHL